MKSLRCSWSIACRCCTNYIFILDLTTGFIGLGKDNCTVRRETSKFGYLVRIILAILRYTDMLIVQPLDASIWGNRNGIYEHLGILLNQINQQYCQQNVCYSLRYRHHAIVTLDGVLADKHAYQTDLLLRIKFSEIVCTIDLGTRTCDIKNIVQYIIHDILLHVL